MNQKKLSETLSAYADGELDLRESRQALDLLAEDPAHAKRVLHQQQLKQACSRAMDRPEMKCPDELRDQLRALADDTPRLAGSIGDTGSAPETAPPAEAAPAYDAAHGRPVLATLGRWAAPLAAAAALFLVATVGLNLYHANRSSGYTSDGLITASLAQSFGDRHQKCSLGSEVPASSELFPGTLSELDRTLAEQVGPEIDGASLDLSSLGFDYQVAGVCPLPGQDAVHLIYENAQGQALSLWIKAYDGKPALDPGVPYFPPSEHAHQPMVVWREGNMVFYLVGDSMDAVKQAQPKIRLAVTS
ncbi:MAG: hypothetical protein AAGG38_09300 [Planctomycetota bacterium]